MKYWTEYERHELKITGKKEIYDDNIYSFDIETSSYIINNGEIEAGIKYKDLSDKDREKCISGRIYVYLDAFYK